MRWKQKTEETPKDGEVKIELKFAWKPIAIGNTVCWLERYEIHHKYFLAASGCGWWRETKKELHNPVYY